MTEVSPDDHTEPIDLTCVRDERARALMASGLPGAYWYGFAQELEAIEAAGLTVTGELGWADRGGPTTQAVHRTPHARRVVRVPRPSDDVD